VSNKNINIFIIIFFLLFSFKIFCEAPSIDELDPVSPYIGTTLTIKGKNFGDINTSSIFFDKVKLDQYSLNIIEWTDNQIKLVLPDIKERVFIKIKNNGFSTHKQLYTKKIENFEYFNPIRYNLVYSVSLKNIRKNNNVEGRIYLYIPQPILSDILTEVNVTAVDPVPNYVQDNGILIYVIDPAEQSEFNFTQTFTITTLYKKINLDNINKELEYDASSPFYKYYTKTMAPFIIPNHARIKEELLKIIGRKDMPVTEKVRLIRRYVIRKMVHKYPPEDRSPLYAIEHGEGDCLSDCYLFATLLRSAGIPVRFSAGYIFYHEWMVTGRHFWQDVFIPGIGWVPVDISYSHNPGFLKRHDYPSDTDFYFGGTDGRRMAFSEGKTVLMKPDEEGKLVYSTYLTSMQLPHVELSDNNLKVKYQLKHKMDLKEVIKLYDDSKDWFIINNYNKPEENSNSD